MANFILTDRKTDYLLPPSLDDWLSEDYLARLVFEVVDQLDISTLTRQYAGRGSKVYHPATMLPILVYGYASGVFSSHKLERITYDSVAFRYISLAPAAILITTPWPRSGAASSASWKPCLYRCWRWRRK
ncbi:MAG: transposase [Burkholderiaceae bacterium]|jgi:transposase